MLITNSRAHCIFYLTLLEIHRRHISLGGGANVARRLPHLEDVVLGRGGNVPLGEGRPRKVVDLGSVPAVHKEELGRPVLGVVGRLFCANRVEVPHVDAPVASRRRKVHRRVRRPRNLQHVVGVRLERVQLERELTDIPQANCLLSAVGGAVKLTWSDEPVMRRLGLLGANATALISALCPSTCWEGLDEFSSRVSQIMSLRSSPTEANM